MKCRKYYRDDEKFKQYRNGYNKRYYDARQYCTNRKARWTDEDIQIVMEHKIPDTAIARKIGRSVKAVQIMRCRMTKAVKQDG